mmetsp:Transcript_31254/g.120373  ORF Transcript_31254/g.120373 Transcript_31254/m.120373 type:complete len:146 (-) Transcript_31254:3786-4223(-)
MRKQCRCQLKAKKTSSVRHEIFGDFNEISKKKNSGRKMPIQKGTRSCLSFSEEKGKWQVFLPFLVFGGVWYRRAGAFNPSTLLLELLRSSWILFKPFRTDRASPVSEYSISVPREGHLRKAEKKRRCMVTNPLRKRFPSVHDRSR